MVTPSKVQEQSVVNSIEKGGGLVGSSRRPNVYTDEELDRAVAKHELFPKLTTEKVRRNSIKESQNESDLSPTS